MRTSTRRANRGIEFVRLESDAPKIGAVFFVRYAVGLGGAQVFRGGKNAATQTACAQNGAQKLKMGANLGPEYMSS